MTNIWLSRLASIILICGPMYLLPCLAKSSSKSRKNLTSLANKYQSEKGSSYGCCDCFTKYYEMFFKPIRNQVQNVLEIGLNEEGRSDCPSLHMWLDYFPNAHIYGIDILKQTFTHPRVTIMQIDQSNPISLQRALYSIKTNFDLIVDDGSHDCYDQQITLIKLFRKLKAGGIYSIEGLYWISSEPSNGTMETLDFLTALQNKETPFVPGIRKEEIDSLLNSISSINFYATANDQVPSNYKNKSLAIILKKQTL